MNNFALIFFFFVIFFEYLLKILYFFFEYLLFWADDLFTLVISVELCWYIVIVYFNKINKAVLKYSSVLTINPIFFIFLLFSCVCTFYITFKACYNEERSPPNFFDNEGANLQWIITIEYQPHNHNFWTKI